MSDKLLLVPDSDVLLCRRYWSGYNMLDSREGYRRLWIPFALGRAVTIEETDEILSRVNGFGPVRFEDSWEGLVRSTEVFWRSSL